MSFLLAGPGAHERRIRSALPSDQHQVALCPTTSSEVMEGIANNDPLVVILGPDLDQETAFGIADTIDLRHPEVVVVLMAQPTDEIFSRAARSGIREVIAGDSNEELLHTSAVAALEAARRRRNKFVSAVPNATGRVVAVLAPKGGVGKTTVSTNLAVGLAQQDGDRTVIVDCDLLFGDVATALLLNPKQTWYDIAQSLAVPNSTTVKAFLTSHSSGLYALCAPESPLKTEGISPRHLEDTIGLLAQEFANVVVDTAAGLDINTIAAIKHATDIALVCGSERAGAESLRRYISALDELGITEARRFFVLNRADAKVGITNGEIAEIVGMEPSVLLPSDRVVPLAMNQGLPIQTLAPRSGIAKAFRQLAEVVFDEPTDRYARYIS